MQGFTGTLSSIPIDRRVLNGLPKTNTEFLYLGVLANACRSWGEGSLHIEDNILYFIDIRSEKSARFAMRPT